LVSCLCFEFRLAKQTGDKHLLVGTTVKPGGEGERGSCWVWAVPQLSVMAIDLQLTKNHRKPHREHPKGVQLISAEHDYSTWSFCGNLDCLAEHCLPLLPVRCRGSTLGQRRCFQSYRNMGFLTSANFESKLAVRDLMWSTKSGTTRSSKFCLSLIY